MAAARVLVTARAFFASGPAASEPLRSLGAELVRARRFGPLPEDDLLEDLRGCAGVIASSDPYSARVIDAAADLRIIARTGVGYDAVDLAAATRRGVVVTITPGRIAETVADYAFALMLALARRVPEAAALMVRGGWTAEMRGAEVFGKCLGIVGMGAVGSAVARRAAGFSMRVLGFDPALAPEEVRRRGAEAVDLDRLLAEADFVTLHASLTAGSRRMISTRELDLMKPTAFLVNTARGGLIDADALLEALEGGRLAGAGIDAFDQEPLPAEHPLRQCARCLLTPHLAFSTRETALDMSRRAAEAVAEVLQGRRPTSCTVLNPDALAGRGA